MAATDPRFLLAACFAATLAACGGGGDGDGEALAVRTTLGCVAGTERLDIVAGDGQSGAPGAVLAQSPTVRLSCESFDNRGNTMMPAGADIEWRSETWPANLVDGQPQVTRQTAADGTSAVAWTLGQSYGNVMRIEARRQSLTARFSASTSGTTTTALRCEDSGGTDHGAALTIASPTAWSAAGSPHRGGTVTLNVSATLSIEAGAVVCVERFEVGATTAGFVSAVGTAQAPIRFIGTALRAGGRLAFVVGDNMPAVGTPDRPLGSLTDSSFGWSKARDPGLCAQVVVGGLHSGAGAALRRVSIAGYGSSDCAALALGQLVGYWDYGSEPAEVRVREALGDGIEVGSGDLFEFFNCEVSANGRHGIVVPAHLAARAPGVYASGCNFFGNGGNAITNLSAASVRASGNWWGDASGPAGPAGDGISGVVDASGPLPVAQVLGY